MRIAIDARPAAFPEKTGIGIYTSYLLHLLPRLDPATTYIAWYLNARGALGGRWRTFPDIAEPNFRERWTPIPARAFRRLTRRLDLPRIEWFMRFDVLFAPNFLPPPTHARRLVLTVHDLAFRLFPETAPHGTRLWLAQVDRWFSRASRIIAVSEATRRDLLAAYPEVREDTVAVIPHGVDLDRFRPASAESVATARERFSVGGPYLVYVGGIEPRKNLRTLVAAFARLPRDLRPVLVIAGPRTEWNPEGWNELQRALDEIPSETRERVRLTGYVSEADKVALLSGAEALVYPSLYEGFGVQVLEAMGCETPVLTSNVSALPEVTGDAAFLVDPNDVESIAAGMERVLRDDALRREMVAKGRDRVRRFSWEETARRTISVLHQA